MHDSHCTRCLDSDGDSPPPTREPAASTSTGCLALDGPRKLLLGGDVDGAARPQCASIEEAVFRKRCRRIQIQTQTWDRQLGGTETQDSVNGPGEEEESSPRKASGQNMLDVILAWVLGVLRAVRSDVDIGVRWRNFDRSDSVAGCLRLPVELSSCWVLVHCAGGSHARVQLADKWLSSGTAQAASGRNGGTPKGPVGIRDKVNWGVAA